jgi:hypothetical protein
MKTKFRREQFYSRPNHSEGPAATWDLWRSTKEEEDAKKQFRMKKFLIKRVSQKEVSQNSLVGFPNATLFISTTIAYLKKYFIALIVTLVPGTNY